MTAQRPEAASPMPTKYVDLGCAGLLVPDRSSRHTRGTFGEMWQWIGDGHSLISLILAARSSGGDAAEDLRHRLLAEALRIREPLRRSPDTGPLRAESAYVPGAMASFVAHVDGVREGIPLHNAVTMAAARRKIYLLHVAATGTARGRELASTLSSSLRLAE